MTHADYFMLAALGIILGAAIWRTVADHRVHTRLRKLEKAILEIPSRDPVHLPDADTFSKQSRAYDEFCKEQEALFRNHQDKPNRNGDVFPDPRNHPSEVIVLSPGAWDELQRVINDPGAPTASLIEAALKYRAAVRTGALKSFPENPKTKDTEIIVKCRDCIYGGQDDAPDGTCGHPEHGFDTGEIGDGFGCIHGKSVDNMPPKVQP